MLIVAVFVFIKFREFINSLDHTKRNLLIAVLLIVALGLTVFISQRQTSYKQRASEVTSPPSLPFPTTNTISLALSTPIKQLTLNQSADVDIYLEAGEQKITGLSFEIISSNSDIVKLQNTILENVFNNQLRNDVSESIYRYAAVDTLGNTATGKVKIATIRLVGAADGFSDIRFQNVEATALGQENLLENQQNADIQLTVVSNATPTIAPPTATPPTTACGILYNRITASFGTSCTTNDPKYDSVADLNKDKLINGQDYSLFLKDTSESTNQAICTDYLSSDANPCTAQPSVTPGDADGNNIVNILDYNIWRDEYLGKISTKKADFNKDDKVNFVDFAILRNALVP
ncbi:MAG: hypothetical protein HYV39_01210 [Candidatus Levybacteria bacterium]|nr:hypothetical protein [Candidatus Levybacteria bacterium]